MTVRVFDEDVTSNEIGGEGMLNLSKAFSAPGVSQTEYVQITRSGKNFGQVYVNVIFQGQAGGFNQGQPAYNQGGYGQGGYNQGPGGFQGNYGQPAYNPNQGGSGW